MPLKVAPASIFPFFVNSVPPFPVTSLPVLVTGIQRYVKPVSAQEGVRLMDGAGSSWYSHVVTSIGEQRRTLLRAGGLPSPHPHRLLLLKSTSVFAIPQRADLSG